jgi:histidyl-tRNA synthetase
MVVEAELISAVSEILIELGFKDFIIWINHRELLRGMLNAANITEKQHNDALISLDKLDKIGPTGVVEDMVQRGINRSCGDRLMGLFISGSSTNNSGKIDRLAEFINGQPLAEKGISDLATILRLSDSKHVEINPALARGLSYYTGAIMEISIGPRIGSLGGGGRYDGLIGMFGKEQIPACGFSLGLERILVVMEERGMFKKLEEEGKLRLDSADVMVTLWNEESISESLKLANELRAQKLRVLVYPEADKLGKQFKYAGQINVPYVCVIGDDELAENKVKVKNMQTREEEMVAREDAASVIQAGIDRK